MDPKVTGRSKKSLDLSPGYGELSWFFAEALARALAEASEGPPWACILKSN